MRYPRRHSLRLALLASCLSGGCAQGYSLAGGTLAVDQDASPAAPGAGDGNHPGPAGSASDGNSRGPPSAPTPIGSPSPSDPTPRAAPTYYVSPGGDDTHSGLSPAAAWQTIARVNAGSYPAGAIIQFAGGHTYAGSIALHDLDGTAGAPITITSDSSGVATLSSSGASGIALKDSQGVVISRLKLVGDGSSSADGLALENTLAAGQQRTFIRIVDTEVTGYGGCGVVLWGDASGFTDVGIFGVNSHDNKKCGIQTLNAGANFKNIIHADVRVEHSTVSNIAGLPSPPSHTGDGIVLGGVEGGLMQYNLVHDCAYNNGSTGGGAAGIWAWQSNRVVIQYNEVYNISSGLNRTDGDAFDLDGGVTHSVVQYNYSHHNDGAGVLVCTFVGSDPTEHNVVRYNISESDAQTHFGAITLYQNSGSPVQDLRVYNNTLYVSNVNAPAIYSTGGASQVGIYNNIMLASGYGSGGSAYLVYMDDTSATFAGNAYWAENSAYWGIFLGSSSYTDLASFRAAGYEKVGSLATGMAVDPKLASPGGGGTLNDAGLLSTLAAYRLQPGSPLIDAAQDVPTLTGAPRGAHDYFGGSVCAGAACDIGAHEAGAIQVPTGTPSPY